MKKLVAILVCLIMIFGSFSVSASTNDMAVIGISISEYEESKAYPTVSLADIETASVEIDVVNLRERVFNAVYSGQTELNIYDLKIPLDNSATISELIFDGMPELFKIVPKIYYSYYTNSNVIVEIIFEYSVTNEEYKAMYNYFVNTVNKTISGLNNTSLTDVQKALILHDRLAIICEYDVAAAEALEEFKKANEGNSDAVAPWDAAFSAYGALVEGSAVCQGYAEAYEYLLEKVGIKSELCNSTLLNHVWNIVYINGISYHVDVTWDDPVWVDENGNYLSKPTDYIEHNNFLLSSLALHQNGHNKNNSYDYNFTPSDTTYDNYFWKDCHCETFLIGNGLYHYNENGGFCEYNNHSTLADSGLGDIDKDSFIKATDISYCRRFLLESIMPDEQQFTACDLTKDGKLSASDLVRFKKILLYLN